MRSLISSRVIGIFAVIELAFIFNGWMSQDFVTASVLSPDQKLVGQIVARREFPYLSARGYVVVRDIFTTEVVQEHLILASDELYDIAGSIRSIKWEGAAVSIDVDKDRYSGPTSFTVNQ